MAAAERPGDLRKRYEGLFADKNENGDRFLDRHFDTAPLLRLDSLSISSAVRRRTNQNRLPTAFRPD
jgi:hypothetical protein